MVKNDYMNSYIDDSSLIKLNILNKQQTLEVFERQIVNRHQAQEITKQCNSAFSQSVRLGFIKPLIVFGKGKGSYSLFYRQEIEEYARNKRGSRVKQRLIIS
ncbi:hypothetical protein [Psychrobacillus phage Perkons]|nr:hypothetical protein [Psychrobacillus phage Perkons]